MRPLWMTREVKMNVNKKRKLFQRYLRSKSLMDLEKYRNQCNFTKRLIRSSVRDFENKIANESKYNVKAFWNYVNKKLKRRTGIGMLMHTDGNTVESDEEKAELLNGFFSSVFVQESAENKPEFKKRATNDSISDIIVTEKMILDKLKKLDSSKSMGPDKLHPHLLKLTSKEICLPIKIIFAKSLSCGTIPEDWKKANVTAVFKKGNRCDPTNYRPISLTCVLCKVLESIIKDNIMLFLETESLLNDCQHGFRKDRSCVTQLIQFMEYLTKSLDSKDTIDILYLDFKKAFDTVPHQRLFTKLKGYGITGNLLQWIISFLTKRTQRVVVNDQMSTYKSVISGVPQGSVLGPLLFILYINDIADAIHSSTKLFADDTKLYNSSTNHHILQKDLHSIFDWAKMWQMEFNVSKCRVLHMGKINPKLQYFVYNNGNLTTLTETNSEKDLGVYFDEQLSFDIHVNFCVERATRLLGLIHRSFCGLNSNAYVTIYKTIVRSGLEYANSIWHPIFKRQSIVIENVQRRATKLISTISHLSYAERLQFLRLPTLKYRRLRGDLILLYKIIHNKYNFNVNDLLTFSSMSSTRGSMYKIFIEGCNTNLRQNSFVLRSAKYWNALSDQTKSSETVNGFKNRIDKELSALFYDFDE